MINLYYTYFKEPLNEGKFFRYRASLPESIQLKLGKYVRWQDAHASLFGKLLLKRGLQDFGLSLSLEDLEYTVYNRPCFKNGIDFNISHSGQYVVCALSDSNIVGVDIEEIKPIDIRDFKNSWQERELEAIQNSSDQQREFYKYWTRKEAVIKADGGGLNLPLREIDVTNNFVLVRNKRWFLQRVPFDGYSCYIAVDEEKELDSLKRFSF